MSSDHDPMRRTTCPVEDRLLPTSRALSRRDALKLFFGIGAAATLANPTLALAEPSASKETLDALASAQAQYDQVQQQLTQLANDYSGLAGQQAQTLNQIEQVQGQIDQTQVRIDERQKDLEGKQDLLAKRISSSYKAGGDNVLSLLLSSATFDELISNVYYMNKVNESDRRLIEDVRDAKEALEAQRQQLESQKADLEQLNERQKQQLSDMQAKQAEVTTVLDGLSQDVKDLMAQRDAEIVEAQRAEQEERRAAAAAAAAAAASKGSGSSGGGSKVDYSSLSDAQQAILSAARRIPSPGGGLCAMWCSQVYQAAGLGYVGGNANDMYASYCHSSNQADLQPGMLVAVSTHPHTNAGRIYGHVGIYMGGGTVRSNVGYIRDDSLGYWLSYYGASVPVRWGYAGGLG